MRPPKLYDAVYGVRRDGHDALLRHGRARRSLERKYASKRMTSKAYEVSETRGKPRVPENKIEDASIF